jgi:hypothetical protein
MALIELEAQHVSQRLIGTHLKAPEITAAAKQCSVIPALYCGAFPNAIADTTGNHLPCTATAVQENENAKLQLD